MKKLILINLCLIFAISAIASGTSYTVSGKVYKGDTNITVGLAAVQITCTWGTNNQCSASGGTTSSNNAQDHGQYSIGWSDCGQANDACPNEDSCVNRNMTLRATKNIGGVPYAGGVSWTAQANTESKTIRIYPTVGARDDIVLGSNPAGFAGPGPQLDQTAVIAFDANGGDSTTVTGFNTTLTYDASKMSCIAVDNAPNSPFTVTYSNIGVPGSLAVNVSGGPVPLPDAGNPIELFTLEWNVLPFETSDYTYVVTDPNSEVIIVGEDPNHPIQSKTEYKIGESTCKPYFRLADFDDWDEALGEEHVKPINEPQWEDYMRQWNDYTVEGNSYPNDVFLPSDLYVYEGNSVNPNEPNDAGLVMGWGDNDNNDGNYASAWTWDYKKDPDLTNCTINLVVTAPQFGLNGQINQVSFGLQNLPQVGGPIRAWYWNCGAAGSGAPITWGVPTRLTINTAFTGVNAATPTASAYMNNPGFNLKVVQFIIVDENGTWVGPANPSPGPGGFQFLWNYWHWIMISPNTTLAKDYYKKWSQAAVVIDPNDPPLIQGWDEYSDYNDPNIIADDWKCTDDRPITDLHWWGSFIGWNDPCAPPVLPKSFHIGIWSDVPDPNNDPCDFSRPGQLIWEHFCDNYVMNFAGYDVDPRLWPDCEPDINEPIEPTEACFQFNQLLSQEDWFYQEHDPCDVNGTVYWLSISAMWDPCHPPTHKWGWKTRPHNWNDDAVIITGTSDGTWPPIVGSMWGSGVPIQHPPYPDSDSVSFDMAFELTTNEPDPNDPPASPDLNYDGITNIKDLAIMADEWLQPVAW